MATVLKDKNLMSSSDAISSCSTVSLAQSVQAFRFQQVTRTLDHLQHKANNLQKSQEPQHRIRRRQAGSIMELGEQRELLRGDSASRSRANRLTNLAERAEHILEMPEIDYEDEDEA